MNLKYPLILASKSPRRQELLQLAGFRFQVQSKETNEDFPDTIPSESVARYLSEKKAEAFLDEIKGDQILLCADTTVLVDSEILGKPENAEEAFRMIEKLSGRSHRVISGACILHRGKKQSFDDYTEVFFRPLTKQEIQYYVENYKPYDKAGAYGIQEWIGMIGIEKIIGSYYTVMGLPIHKVYHHLAPFSQDFK